MIDTCFFFFLMIRRPPRSTRTAHSFPTRRSSDLTTLRSQRESTSTASLRSAGQESVSRSRSRTASGETALRGALRLKLRRQWHLRSEEHTSELQSLMRISYAVFCLKKKKQTNYTK